MWVNCYGDIDRLVGFNGTGEMRLGRRDMRQHSMFRVQDGHGDTCLPASIQGRSI
jgi:hypothetical protein